MPWIYENIKKGARFDTLVSLTWKKRNTIKVYFNRNWLDILNEVDFKYYLDNHKNFKKGKPKIITN